MKPIIFALPGNEVLANHLVRKTGADKGDLLLRRFSDGESYVRVLSEVSGKKAFIVCTLNQPDDKVIPLYYTCRTLSNLGAKSICLLAPYLAYMRQDKIFKMGEGLTSQYFADLLSGFVDTLVTVDPHLHRIRDLKDVYSISTHVLHSSDHLAEWIKDNAKDPVLIGPDRESEQWVGKVAEKASAPFVVMEKLRHGDRQVKITISGLKRFSHCYPILIDDIISTGSTMKEMSHHLEKVGMEPPVCMSVHAVFTDNSYENLKQARVKDIVTCNTIIHPSNGIDLIDLYVDYIRTYERED